MSKKKRQFFVSPKRYRFPFNPTMVRAIVAREKGETRRLRGLDEVNKHPDRWHLDCIKDGKAVFSNSAERLAVHIKLPVQEGQTMSVAEPIRLHKRFDEYTPAQVDHGVFTFPQKFGTFAELQIFYPSDGQPVPEWAGKLTPGMFMPSRFARIELPVQSVRTERLSEITSQESIDEGAFFWAREKKVAFNVGDPRSVFYQLWDSVNPDMPSTKNPWVFVIKFQKWGEETEE